MSVIDILLLLFLFWIFLFLIFSLIKNTNFGKKISENVEIQPLVLLLKTTRFNRFILNSGKKRSKFYRIVGELSIIYGIALMIYALFFLMKNLINLLFPSQSAALGEASPIIPIIFGITFTPPLDQLIIILIVITLAAVFHELFHGFLASSHEMKIKSTGTGLLFMIPIAFVELDDESLKNTTPRKKLRMLGAGSFINLIQAMIFLTLFLSYPLAIAWGYSYDSSGVLIYSITPNSPASIAGLAIGDAIIALNHTQIKNYQEFSSYLEKTKPNQTLIITVERNLKNFDITIKLAQHPYYKDRGFIGVSTLDYHKPYFEFFPQILQYWAYLFFAWGFVICFSLAVFNMLPIPLFDGDKFLAELLSIIKNKEIRSITHNTLRVLSITLLLLNIYFSLIRFGFV